MTRKFHPFYLGMILLSFLLIFSACKEESAPEEKAPFTAAAGQCVVSLQVLGMS